jgi:hypothetical protein
VSEKSQLFGDVVQDKWTKNNNLEFLIGYRDFVNPIHDPWEPVVHLTGSQHMMRELNNKWEQDYLI